MVAMVVVVHIALVVVTENASEKLSILVNKAGFEVFVVEW